MSQATVSMVLNKKYNVSFSRETVEKVENAAKDLGYILPKRRSAKNSKNSRLIVVFCPTLTNPYYVMLLQGIETVAKEKGYGGIYLQHSERIENRGAVSPDDAQRGAGWNYLHL